MTAQTLAYIKSTLFATGQASGAITALRSQDIADTIGARTPFAIVTQPEYGADATGSADSTAAFNLAKAASDIILVPPGTYKLAGFQPASGSSIIGMNGHNFYGSANSIVAPVTIVPVGAATTSIFDMHLGPSCVRIEGLDLNGSGATTCSGICGGGKSLTLKDLTIRNFTAWGIGGSISAGNPDTFESHIINCDVYTNLVGIGDLIDSWVIGGSVTFNGTNVQFVSGDFSGANTFVGHRNEWSTSGYGFQITGGDTIVENPGSKTLFIGCFFDRNFNGAVDINTARGFTFSGCHFGRNGSVAIAGSVSCQMRLNGASHVVMTGCTSLYGRDDGDSGNSPSSNQSPPVFARFAGTNTDIIFMGNDMSGYTALPQSNTAWFAGSQPTTRFVCVHNIGTGTAAQDVDTR